MESFDCNSGRGAGRTFSSLFDSARAGSCCPRKHYCLVDAATPSTTVNTAFVPTCTISHNALPHQTIGQFLNYIEQDVEFNSLALTVSTG